MASPPTAIYFADPLLAVGAVNKAHKLGIRIPDEMSIIGFDDTDVRYSVYPTLTAVCQDASALGFEAALWLTRRVSGSVNHDTLQKTLPTFFEVNQSTGPAPQPVCQTVTKQAAMDVERPRTHAADSTIARLRQTGSDM